jgi:pimeloyl-ACP methyl ester carboxylesterase
LSQKSKETPIIFQSQNEQLVGILHTPPHETKNLIIMCHGFTGNKVESRRLFVEAARKFCHEGYAAFRFDFYGSGDSAGEFAETTISRNIANLVDAIAWGQGQNFTCITILGLSMGAATAILTLVNHPMDALITWSAVPDMKALFEAKDANFIKSKDKIKSYEYNGWLLHNEFWNDALKYDVQQAVSQLEMPKFIVQGGTDQPVFLQGFEEFKLKVQPPCDFMMMPGAGHTFETVQHRGQLIRNTVIWLKRHIP